MDKHGYSQLRAQLDFKLNHRYFALHVLLDLLLVGLPAGYMAMYGREWNWSATHVGLCLLSAISLAAFYFRSFSMMHECVHGLVSTNRRWNDLAGLFYGTACFLPFAQWREIHLLHHYWAGNVEKDPVRKLTLIFRQPPTASKKFLSLLWPTWFPVLALMQTYVFWFECTARFSRKAGLIGFLGLALPLLFWPALFLACGPAAFVMILAPSILAYLALVEVVNFPHHTDLPQYEGEVRLALWDQYKIARSCFYPRLLEHFILLNFNYHTEHHLYPTLPWYRLAALSPGLRGQIAGYNFSLGNEWIRRNRKRPLAVVCTSQSEDEPEIRKAA